MEPQFTLTTYLHMDFAFNNRLYSHGVYLNRDLEVHGPIIHGSRNNFSFIRSDRKDRKTIIPQPAGMTFQMRYPCMVYRAPNPKRNKIIFQSYYWPEQIRCLDLGEWTYCCGIENMLRLKSKGQIQPFTAIAKSPDGTNCLI